MTAHSAAEAAAAEAAAAAAAAAAHMHVPTLFDTHARSFNAHTLSFYMPPPLPCPARVAQVL